MSTDEQIGKNVSRFRGELSQKDVAAAMKKLGWRWSQATVWSVETGERPLRLAEAEDLARIFNVGVRGASVFTGTDAHAGLRYWIRQAGQAYFQIREAFVEFNDMRIQVAMSADLAAQDGGLDGLEETQVNDWVPKTVEDIVREWREHPALGEGDTIGKPGQKPGRYFELLLSSEEERRNGKHPETS